MSEREKVVLQPTEMACMDCRFCELTSDDSGMCRLNPPTVYYDSDEGGHDTMLPVVFRGDWCGQFEWKCGKF